MRSTVFLDRRLAKQAGRFVWLSIDTEKSQNAPFLEAHPIDALPTLLVLDPLTGAVALKWLGSLTVPELERLLEDAERAVAKVGGTAVEQALARADRLYGERKLTESIDAYLEVLRQSPPGWAKRPRAVESLLAALSSANDEHRCAQLAAQEAPALPRGPAFANVAASGLACAVAADRNQPWREGLLTSLQRLVEEALPLPGLLADDRSGLYEGLVEAEEERGNKAAAQERARSWLAFLEQQAAAAATPEARAAFDPHRLNAAEKAGELERAIPPLLASERDLPGDYNAPARLAYVYRSLNRLGEARAAIERALVKGYGPRRIRLLESKATIQVRQGDPLGARQTLEEAIHAVEALPASQRTASMTPRIKAALEALSTP